MTGTKIKEHVELLLARFSVKCAMLPAQSIVLFPIEETIVRSITTYSKLGLTLLSCLFYEPWLRYIANQSGSGKETVSPKIGENIEMLVCFICVGTQDRILINIVIIHYYLFFIFSWQVKMHHTYNTKDIK